MTPAERLGDFRRLVAGRAFAYGVSDCGTFCADWVRLVRGVDPAADWRGRYSTAIGLARMLKRRGGIVAHFDACLAACHIERTDEPKSGDIVIVETPEGLTGGIVSGPMVMLTGYYGLIMRHRCYALTVAAWRV